MSADPETHAAAREAHASAIEFSAYLAGRLTKLSDALRRGEDGPALMGLGESAEHLEDFLTYLFLISDSIEADESLKAQLVDYRTRLAQVVAALEPALDGMDLVEVADTLELDVVSSLEDYAGLHPAIGASLQQSQQAA